MTPWAAFFAGAAFGITAHAICFQILLRARVANLDRVFDYFVAATNIAARIARHRMATDDGDEIERGPPIDLQHH